MTGLVISRKSDDELDQLANDLVRERVFVAYDEPSMRCAFSSILLLLDAPTRASLLEQADRIGLLYEYYDKAGPRSMNGYPMFMSVQFLHRDDVETFRALAARKQAALEATG